MTLEELVAYLEKNGVHDLDQNIVDAALAACRVVAKMKTPGIVRCGGSPVADLDEALEPEWQALGAALAKCGGGA